MKISELPQEIKKLALEYQRNDKKGLDKTTDLLCDAFWWDDTKEGYNYWDKWDDKEPIIETLDFPKLNDIKEPIHYDNTNGSLYQFCEQQGLNSYEFDIIKRVMRCRKKGNFIEDLEKTKFLIDLYIKEQSETLKFPNIKN